MASGNETISPPTPASQTISPPSRLIEPEGASVPPNDHPRVGTNPTRDGSTEGRQLEPVDAGLHCGNAPFATYVGMMIPALPNVHATV